MKMKTAIVNSRSFGRYSNAIDRLNKVCEVLRLEVQRDIGGAELAEKLRGVSFVIASTTPKYAREFFENNDDVVLIARHGIGLDNIDIDAATEHGVIVTRVPGYIEREAVAEHTIALILGAIRWVTNASISVRNGEWSKRGKYVGFEISGKTVGIIGLGNIGSRVAEILIRGFNAKVIAYDPYVSPKKAEEIGVKLVDLETLLRSAQIITLHCSLTNETYHILNRETLRLARRGVIIVNTARGELIDTHALIEALEDGRIGFAALDVIEDEPITGDHLLLRYDNVIRTPHIASYTLESLRGMDDVMVRAVEAVIRGEIPEGTVNREVYERRVRSLPRVNP